MPIHPKSDRVFHHPFAKFTIVFVMAVSTVLVSGCHISTKVKSPKFAPPTRPVQLSHNESTGRIGNGSHDNGGSPIDVSGPNTHFSLGQEHLAAPRTSSNGLPESFVDISLDNIIAMGLQDTRVLRSLNAQVLVNPAAVGTGFETAIGDSNPTFGSAAALAEFDAIFQSDLSYARNDDVFNNAFLGGGTTEVQQDLTRWNWNLSKTNAYGTSYSLTSQLQHDNNDNPSSVFPHSWRTLVEATVRKPLLQGAGLQFNRIAGPAGQPGFRFSSGILVSQIANEISSAEFEQGVRDYVNEVVASYWDLYFAYRNFSSATAARDNGYETWMLVKSRFESDLEGGEADAEAQAREQYYEFQQRVNDALSGSRTGVIGVLQAEANLRRLVGLPQTEYEFLRPSDEPLQARVAWQWEELVHEAMARRVEIRQQIRQIRRRELELVAARNFTKPRLDAVGTYRNNGFGDDLSGGDSGRFGSALGNATDFDHDEWEFGLQYNMALGFRRAHSGVRHAELNLQRENAVLEEQGKQIVHDLGSAFRELDRSFMDLQFATERYSASKRTVETRTAAYEEDLATIVDLLDSQRRLSQAEVDWYQARAQYTRANFDLMRESGRLLSDLSVVLDDSVGAGL